jgi:hypothetical protein
MRGWSLQLSAFLLGVASLAFGQVGNGTITGTVTDPANAVIAGARVEAKNAETGVVYSAASTSAGLYTITDLPVGTYTVTVTVMGFKTYTHTKLALSATQTLKEDVPLQIGATSESVNVTAEASLLKTESGELGTNVNIDQLDQLPLLGIGTVNAGTSGYRNPYNTLLTLPGVSSYASSGQFAVNGLGGTSNGNVTETMRIEGQDATSRIFGTYDYTQMAQPGADSIQEIAYQTSNYAPEFGQAGSVLINMTMKSGTNKYSGSAYDYFVNEDLNAGDPFSVNTAGTGKVRPINRRNNFGGTLGGPISIPKVYNGHNKSFFFFSYEQFLESTLYSDTDTVPAPAYLKGDFSAISPNGTCSLCGPLGIQTTGLGIPAATTDALGRQLFANEIYDPLTRGVNAANNLGYATPFQGNMIPLGRIDPISAKIAALFPAAQNSNLTGNFTGNIRGGRYSAIPAVKIDHNIDAKDKLSFYYSENNTESQISGPLGNQDGLPQEIGGYRGTFIPTYTERLNYDRTITPTLLLHLGAGYLHTSFSDRAPFLKFDPSSFGLSGFLIDRQFPSVTGMCTTSFFVTGCANATGGMQNIGTAGQIQSLNYEEKPSFNANTTWVHGKHTYKAGAELYFEQGYTGSFAGVTMATGTGPTVQPFQPTVSFGGYTQGFGYASFLLGDYTESTQTPQENTRLGMAQWALFVQDSWKVTRKLTLDYGLRWDLATPQHEQYGRLGQLDETALNTNAGNHPGAMRYASTCHCDFYPGAYPYAIGPRIGLAYQIDPKTVLRAGWGVVYQFVGNAAGAVYGTAGNYALSPVPGGAQYVNDQAPGFIVQPTFPVTDPSVYPIAPGTLGAAGSFFQAATEPYMPDPQQNRPPRINQYSVGIQREITRSFIMEASYVGNHAVWIQGPYGFLSQTSAAAYAKYGLYPYPGTGPAGYNNDNDRALLGQPISSTQVVQAMAARGITNLLPYSSFPTDAPLQDILYPFPQFPGLEPSVSPTGYSHYDSLQMKATKRLSHHLQAGGTYTWGKGFTSPAAPQDFFNHVAEHQDLQQIPPQTINFNFIYTTPTSHGLPKWANLILGDWQLGGFANYQSGMYLTPPVSQTASFLPSEDVRVKGQPLYTQGVNPNNLSSYNPYYTQVLNPNAWAPCPVNATCAAQGVLYSDFRAPRTPVENANIGRNFRINERINLFVRAEFVNIFNRTLMPPPTTTGFFGVDPSIPPAKNGQGIYVAGFGTIGVYNPPGAYYAAPSQATSPYLAPRTGTLIARFSF